MNEHCIVWRGKCLPGRAGGYGRSPRSTGGRAHRWAYRLFHGQIPPGMLVMHVCDNPPCINPLHLRLGTSFDNQRDSVQKGRNARTKRTHCPRGHAYTWENIRRAHFLKTGKRNCGRCDNERRREREARSIESPDAPRKGNE